MEKRMGYNEHRQMMRFAGAASTLQALADEEAFAKRIKTAKRDLKMMAAVAMRIVHDVSETMPNEQRVILKNELKRVKCYTRVEQIEEDRSAYKTSGRWVSYDDLDTLYTAAGEKCMTCSGQGEEYYKCQFRKVFDKYSAVGDKEDTNGCKYAVL